MKSARLSRHLTPINILYFILGTLLLGVLLFQIDFQGLVLQILSVPVGLLLLGAALYLVKSAVRGFRFWRINAPTGSGYWRMLRLTLATSLASQLLPLKMGELAYVYIVKKEFQSTIPQGLSTLIIIRIFDMLSVALLFVVATLSAALPANLSIYFDYISIFIGALLVLLVGLIIVGRFFPKIASRLPVPLRLQKMALFQKAYRALENLFAELSKFRGAQYLELIGYSLLEWAINFVMYAVLLRGIGLTPGFLDPIVAVTFAILANLLPLNSFGNFGTQDAGWATGMVLLGYPQEIALTSAFSTHLIQLSYMIIYGGIAWLSYLVSASTSAQRSPSQADQG